MNTRKYSTNPEVLLEQGKAILSSTDESRFHFRVFAVNMVLSGCPASQVSDMAGVSKATVKYVALCYVALSKRNVYTRTFEIICHTNVFRCYDSG